ncbi:unnamed protein product [Schistocephalus solidus]|uniref:WD repeat and FYVE domain-containing protein 3 n=1 Tax=Schistocephalus solidus TaxID=70667 RepID=A0A3P7C7L6_SCHSO|nr:unnamed protein product [Schistocephalus solidus]
MESELTQDRSIWGPVCQDAFTKWHLDPTEGPCRMRKRMLPNPSFYQHYNLSGTEALDSEKSILVCDPTGRASLTPRSSDSSLGETEAEFTPQAPSQASAPTAAATTDSGSSSCSSKTTKASDSSPTDRPDQLTVEMVFTRLLAPGERIQAIYRCARICGLDVHEGLLLFGRENFYLIDGYTLLNTGGVADIGALPAGMVHEPVVPTTTSSRRTHRPCSTMYFRLPYDKIREVHRRRYLLQQTALEVFNCDGCNFLLVFAKDLRNKVFDCSGLLSSLLGEKTVMKRWERGEISNFQYLMYVNTQAGRSYNDLMQYPVFPWVLADYTSEVLDLTRPSTFRDLSKPMGAQTQARLTQFQRRFREWDDPSGETPPYHYGTHYSSAMIVASYLVRMEPFAQHFIKLQGGHFDLADRMFHSVEEAWLSASQHNMADVRELVPEFFYLPDFLVNSNKFDLGHKQNGTLVDDVVLPPWAKNDPREFIRAHREALESEYVSANLHHWIDLIFGYKQRGAPAVQAANVFHHLFYEGNVDIYAIDDPVKRRAVVGFINNFGQIPRQIFRKPHPAKKVPDISPNSTSGLFFHNLGTLKPFSGGPIVVVEQNKVLLPPTFTRCLAWGFPDDSFRICSLADGREKVLQVFETVSASRVLCAVAPNASTIITAGLNSAIKVWQVPFDPTLSPFTHLYGHTDVVTCLAASEGFNMIVSGSRDCTCIMWDLRYLIFLRQLGTYRAPVAAICISEASGDIAVCAGSHLHLWNISGEPIASLNTTPDQSNQIFCVSMSTVSMVTCHIPAENAATSDSTKLSLRAELTMHTAFERADNPRPAALTAICVSRDHRSVLVGDSRGRVFACGGGGGGGPSDNWIRDEAAISCAAPACAVRFSITERRHHCRNCGKIFCSRYLVALTPVRWVFDKCRQQNGINMFFSVFLQSISSST